MTSGIGVSSRYDDGVNRVNGREASLATIVAKLGVSAVLDELAQAVSATMPARRVRARLIRLHAMPRWEPMRGGCSRRGRRSHLSSIDAVRLDRVRAPEDAGLERRRTPEGLDSGAARNVRSALVLTSPIVDRSFDLRTASSMTNSKG